MNVNYYETLGVSKDSSQEEIKEHYLFYIQAYHPDKFHDTKSKEIAEEKAKLINQAYSVLKNPNTRREYDSEINVKSTKNASGKHKNAGKNKKPNDYGRREKTTSYSSKTNGKEKQTRRNIQTCQKCHKKGRLRLVSFYRVYCILFWIRTRKVRGYFCGSCAIEYFWKFTTISLMFGWWGFGLLVTPLYLITNLVNHNKTRPIRKNVRKRINTAFEWKLLCFGILIIFTSGILIRFGSNQQTVASITSPTSEIAKTRILPNTQKQPTKISYLEMVRTYEAENQTNSPTKEVFEQAGCSYWNTITLDDVGKTSCVYGVVYDSYWGGDIFYIRFSDEPYSFRFIVLNNYYFDNINGRCIRATGEIKRFENLPYIELGEYINFCD